MNVRGFPGVRRGLEGRAQRQMLGRYLRHHAPRGVHASDRAVRLQARGHCARGRVQEEGRILDWIEASDLPPDANHAVGTERRRTAAARSSGSDRPPRLPRTGRSPFTTSAASPSSRRSRHVDGNWLATSRNRRSTGALASRCWGCRIRSIGCGSRRRSKRAGKARWPGTRTISSRQSSPILRPRGATGPHQALRTAPASEARRIRERPRRPGRVRPPDNARHRSGAWREAEAASPGLSGL